MKRFFTVIGMIGLSHLSLAVEPATVDQMVSTGDNHYLANSLPVDSASSINDSFEMFKQVFNTKRIYWRGLQEAAWAETTKVREENFRYATFHQWSHHLINDLNIEKMAVDIAHKKGIELWGVASLGDWGSSADTPGFNDFPFNSESKLRLEHPEWVPVDKYGYRRQGGTIELAYPEARKALVDLHVRLAKKAGYDGIMFLTYVENFSLRFQDEFGYSEPIVQEFKKRYGIDIRQQEFTRYASLYDWRKLRGEYVTKFFTELKTALEAEGIKLGVFLNPQDIHKPLIWATLPYDYQTIGNLYMDVDGWVRDGIVDRLLVWGGCAPVRQNRTLEDVLWLTRDTRIQVGGLTSNPYKGLVGVDQAVQRVATLDSESSYFSRSALPEQTEEALSKGTVYEQMKFLSQVIEGHSKCSAEKIIPFTKNPNVLMRRMALMALGVTKDPQAVPVIEAALFDLETGVRGAAMAALASNNGPQTIEAIFQSLEKDGTHPLGEMARNTVPRLRPPPVGAVITAASESKNPQVRNLAVRSLGLMPVPATERDAAVDVLIKSLADSDAYVRYSAAMSLVPFRSSPQAIGALLTALKNPDAPMADRAAVSLGEIVAAGYNGESRLKIAAGLMELFEKFGDGTTRSDKDWGHRSVGDALLSLGEDGNEALDAWIKQDQDKRLAEMAWQVKYFREKAGGNKFNIITEKENEEAYRMRPPHMRRLLVERISQDFEETLPAEGSFGAGDKLSGRWSSMSPKGTFPESKTVHSGKQSVKLVRGGGVLLGRVVNGVNEGYGYEVEVWINRAAGGALTLSAADSKGAESVAVRVDANGTVERKDEKNSAKWDATGLIIPEGKWTQLTIRTNPLKKNCQIGLNVNEEESMDGAAEAPLWPTGSVERVVLTATGEEPSAVFIDDVKLVERH